MELNEMYHGFKLVSIKPIKDIDSTLYEFKHIKSQATLLFLENEDTNKCFAAGFRTLPEDSTGVCHIIEHSLLCGSKKYPLKEPFVNLLKGSMSTFLNAMTAMDWTIYPVASQNDKDFDNLMSVYLDSVFAPLSIENEKPFLQEGWHLEMNDINDTPFYKGVVYNEMKGAMSSVDEQLQQATLEALYKGTSYEYNSGGDPEVIPTLTYQYYKDFYKKHYVPSNGLLYLYGKMDILPKLKYIDEEYLSHFEPGKEEIKVQEAKPHINLDFTKKYEIPASETEKDNTYMSLAFGLDKYDNVKDLMAMSIINTVIMGNNDSPLKKAILEAEIGQDVDSSIDDDNIVPSYHIFLKKSNPNCKDKFREVVFNTCKELVEKGLDKKALLATINRREFNDKEMDSGRSPKGLFFVFDLLQSFCYGMDYVSHLEYSKYYDFFRKEIDNGYFEKVLEKYIVNSKFYTEVVLLPSKTLGKEKEEAMAKKMEDLKNALSVEEKEQLVKQTKELYEYQNHKDTKEELALLPHLALEDIGEDINSIPLKKTSVNKVTTLVHEFSTNGIGYLKLYFDLKTVKYKDLPYVYLLSTLLTRLPTENYDVIALQSEIKTYLGAFSKGILLSSKDKNHCEIKFSVEVSALKENMKHVNPFVDEVLNKTVFTKEKVKPYIIQMATMVKDSIIESGNAVGMVYAQESTSMEGKLASSFRGIRLYNFLNKIIKKNAYDELVEKLQELSKQIFTKKNLVVSISGSSKEVKELKHIVRELPFANEKKAKQLKTKIGSSKKEALVIPSEVSYNVVTSNLEDLGFENTGHLSIAQHIINLDYLWSEIRVKGGAYGCGLRVNTANDIAISSFRDPNVKKSYEAYRHIAEYLENLEMSQEELTSYIIGAAGSIDLPASNNAMVISSDVNYFRELTDDIRRAKKREMVETTLEDVKSYAALFRKLADEGSLMTIGNKKEIDGFESFDVVQKL